MKSNPTRAGPSLYGSLHSNLERGYPAQSHQITRRSHNLDADVIEQLNRVIRGTADCFATPWSNRGDLYRSLDRWIRMRLQCMKLRQESKANDTRLRLKHFKKPGLLDLNNLRPSSVT